MGEEWIIRMREERQLLVPEREEEILERRCIYRVPNYMRSLNKNVYTPQVVSLGPYHHHHSHDCCESPHPYLKNMEPVKQKILHGLLELKGTELEDVAAAMKKEVRELMDAYEGLEEPWTGEDRFIELMILDGCFVLANVLAHNRKLNPDDMERSPLRYAMYAVQPVSQEVVADMILLENQVPFRAVQILAELLTPKGMIGDDGLEAYMIDIVLNDESKSRRKTSYHMLDLMRQVLLNEDFIYKGNESMGTVTELIEKGVSFRASSRDVRFSNGVLTIRCCFLEPNAVDRLFANTMAYEKMKDLEPVMLSFLGFMDCLIDTAKDVALLREKGIISGWIGSDEQVAALFNRLVKQVPSPPPNYRGESRGIDEQVIEYCGKRRHRWWASFKNLYLKNPWVFISMLAGIILLAVTVLQAVYQVLGYYNP